jgi:hypothetical protein
MTLTQTNSQKRFVNNPKENKCFVDKMTCSQQVGEVDVAPGRSKKKERWINDVGTSQRQSHSMETV